MARVNTLVFFPSQTSRTQASSFLSHSETPTPGCKKAFHRSEILRDPSRHLFNLSRTLCLTISTFLNPILTSAPQASRSSHPAQSREWSFTRSATRRCRFIGSATRSPSLWVLSNSEAWQPQLTSPGPEPMKLSNPEQGFFTLSIRKRNKQHSATQLLATQVS